MDKSQLALVKDFADALRHEGALRDAFCNILIATPLPMPSSLKKQVEQKLAQSQQSQPPDPKVQAEQIKVQTEQARQEHQFRMEQLAEERKTRAAEHSARRQQTPKRAA